VGLAMEWIEFTHPNMTIFDVCRETDCIVPGLYAMVSRLGNSEVDVIPNLPLDVADTTRLVQQRHLQELLEPPYPSLSLFSN
jgi:hypothetical protein